MGEYSQDELDSMVHDAKSVEASAINNSGRAAQMSYLFGPNASSVVELEGLAVELYRNDNGKLTVGIDGPGDSDLAENDAPDIRIWLNDALIYAVGKV